MSGQTQLQATEAHYLRQRQQQQQSLQQQILQDQSFSQSIERQQSAYQQMNGLAQQQQLQQQQEQHLRHLHQRQVQNHQHHEHLQEQRLIDPSHQAQMLQAQAAFIKRTDPSVASPGALAYPLLPAGQPPHPGQGTGMRSRGPPEYPEMNEMAGSTPQYPFPVSLFVL